MSRFPRTQRDLVSAIEDLSARQLRHDPQRQRQTSPLSPLRGRRHAGGPPRHGPPHHGPPHHGPPHHVRFQKPKMSEQDKKRYTGSSSQQRNVSNPRAPEENRSIFHWDPSLSPDAQRRCRSLELGAPESVAASSDAAQPRARIQRPQVGPDGQGASVTEQLRRVSVSSDQGGQHVNRPASSYYQHVQSCRCKVCRPDAYHKGYLKESWPDPCKSGCLCTQCLATKTAVPAELCCRNQGHVLPRDQQCRRQDCTCKVGCSDPTCNKCQSRVSLPEGKRRPPARPRRHSADSRHNILASPKVPK